MSYLWDKDWDDKERAEQTRRNFEAVSKREKEREEEDRTKKERRLEQYMELKKEFESTNLEE